VHESAARADADALFLKRSLIAVGWAVGKK
jgi:hypothetical protein